MAQAGQINVPIQRTNVQNNVSQGGQAQADLATAQAGASQINLRRQQIATYQAQALQAKAALQNAQVQYNDCFLYAPTDGEVVKKAVNPGSALSPGQTVVTISQSNDVWVEANFKETQLTDVKPGQDAEVEVDTFPHLIFHGYVQAVNEATGAATALLPPDNATGNFTKVVQRIPVRIEVYAADDNEDKQYARAADIQKLRQGMSVTATIDTSDDSGKEYRNHQQNNGGGNGAECRRRPVLPAVAARPAAGMPARPAPAAAHRAWPRPPAATPAAAWASPAGRTTRQPVRRACNGPAA